MNQPQTALRVPETMGPSELGSYMRGLREHFKLSQQDVSEQLHIRVRYVAAIEDAKYETMPGKVYARGYVHTYAEFLGLDAEQVVAQCFPPEEKAAAPMSLSTPVAPLKPAAIYSPKTLSTPAPEYGRSGRMKPLVGILIAGALIFGGYSLLSGSGDENEQQAEGNVVQVPETLLASVRGVVMPRAQNYECLTGDSELQCFFSQRVLKDIELLQRDAAAPYAEDLAHLETVEPAAVEEEAPSSPAEEASPPND